MTTWILEVDTKMSKWLFLKKFCADGENANKND
jgi:hypothetical protein